MGLLLLFLCIRLMRTRTENVEPCFDRPFGDLDHNPKMIVEVLLLPLLASEDPQVTGLPSYQETRPDKNMVGFLNPEVCLHACCFL